MDAVLSLIDRDPLLLLAAVLLVMSHGAVLALVFAWRIRSDRKAAARARVPLPWRLPDQMEGRIWDFDERGRPW